MRRSHRPSHTWHSTASARLMLRCLLISAMVLLITSATYEHLPGRACPDRHEVFSRVDVALDACRDLCTDQRNCLSFAWRRADGACHASSSCTASRSVVDPTFDLHVKRVQIDWAVVPDSACVDHSETTATRQPSAEQCRGLCEADGDCVSYGWQDHTKTCRPSHTCAFAADAVEAPGWVLGLKEVRYAEDCLLGPWSYAPCSALCGAGTTTRTRPVLVPAANGGTCGATREAVGCTGPCAGIWIAWSALGP